MKNWYSISARGDACEVSIYDEIGSFGVSAKDFSSDFASVPDQSAVTLRINSPGGSVFDALAIYNVLDRHAGEVTVVVDGIAASAASYIAMAGDRVQMPDNAFMMIHDPSAVVMGQSKDMRDMAETLDKIGSTLATAYMRKSGKAEAEVVKALAAETWFTAQEAVDFGLADEVTTPVKMAASFDLGGFKNAPEISFHPSAEADSIEGGGLMADEKASGDARKNAEATAAEIVAKAEAEAKAASEKMLAEARAQIERERAIHDMDAPQAMKDEFLTDAFASVPVDALAKIVAAAPVSLEKQVAEAGGAGVEPSPNDFAGSPEASSKADQIAAAAEAMAQMKGSIL